MISDENQEIIRCIVRDVLREELERWAVKRKPPQDLTEKRRAAARIMLEKRAARAIAEQTGNGKKRHNGEHSRANAEQKKATKEKFIFPDWLIPHRDVWDAWIEARQKTKHPPTDFAKSLAVTKLEHMQAEGHNVRRLLADAAFNNWQSFYPPKEGRDG